MLGAKFVKQFIKQYHLARRLDHNIKVLLSVPAILRQFILHLFNQKWVIAALSQLDLEIIQLRGTCSSLRKALEQHVLIPLIERAVNRLLNSSHLNVDNGLLQWGDHRLDVFLLPTKDVGLQNLIQFLDLLGSRQIAEFNFEIVESRELNWLDEIQ